MGHSQIDKGATHVRIVERASERFREVGVEGVSISDLMKEVGLTHGGFYKHFPSREALVTEAVGSALESSRARSEDAKGQGLAKFIGDYLSPRHRDDPGTGCAVCALMNDMSRAPDEARAVYTEHVRRSFQDIAEKVSEETADANGRAHAILTLSVLVGALGLSRAVSDEALSDEILATVRRALVTDLTKKPGSATRSRRPSRPKAV